jgi:hypothetical protein
MKDKGQTKGRYCGIMASSHLKQQFTPTPKTVTALPPSAELDRAATRVASPGCDAAAGASWGSASDTGMGLNKGHHGGGLVQNRKKTDLPLEPGSYRRTWYMFYGRARKAR